MSEQPKVAVSGKRRGGRKPGVPNKVTQSAREIMALLVERNLPKMDGWLTKIEQEHGALVAWKCMQDVAEYHIPKLQRTEMTGEGGGPLTVTINKVA